MTKVSLARIMYGTNEDLQGSRPLKRNGSSAIALPISLEAPVTVGLFPNPFLMGA